MITVTGIFIFNKSLALSSNEPIKIAEDVVPSPTCVSTVFTASITDLAAG